ncbi:uncharacterized protein FPOAC1_013795 [Fusarium poae]|uniref:uncharacterized protein n=1 Tax=Fusarium poae TaxID=36050 RepID=UPI001D04BBAD|nr:uncharacterized protein FPOAC1_013795 [Fusarium poae]KAG8664457.1 hypothetical protein FPOAC1_013795 [Fusarium poae]
MARSFALWLSAAHKGTLVTRLGQLRGMPWEVGSCAVPRTVTGLGSPCRQPASAGFEGENP